MSAHRNPPLEIIISGTPWGRVMHLAQMLKAQVREAQTHALGEATYDRLQDAEGEMEEFIAALGEAEKADTEADAEAPADGAAHWYGLSARYEMDQLRRERAGHLVAP
jgi:hypothetical protein